MSNDSGPNLPPFPSSYRASGLLLHVTSLPSSYGIGDVGPAAIAWIDQRSDAGQRNSWSDVAATSSMPGDTDSQLLKSDSFNLSLAIQA